MARRPGGGDLAFSDVRVAMFVLGDCENDGRVRKEATTLHDHGYDVRVFAMATRTHAARHASVGSVPIERLPAVSWPQRLVRFLRLRSRAVEPTSTGSSPGEDSQRSENANGSADQSLKGSRWHAARDVALRVHRPTLMLSYTRLAVAAARAWGPNIVHAHDASALPAAALVAKSRLPLVYDSHELWRRRNRLGQRRPLGRLADALVERALAPRAAVVVTVSNAIAAWLSRRYPLRRSPVVVRNLPTASRSASQQRLHSLAGLTDARVLLYTGRLMEGRGLEFAVRCLHALPDNVVFVLMGYGDPTYVAGLRSLASGYGVTERIRIIGAVPSDEVTSVASAADVAYVVIEPICESYRYALPGKLFEAIAAGLPVLAADLPEIREIVEGHGVGRVFTPRTAGGFRTVFDRVLHDAPRYRQAAEQARKTLNWEQEQNRLLDAYASIVPMTAGKGLDRGEQ